ncbi:MAG TPA: histidine kinase [Actinoplanes sp.]|nr:histidine kinase [Actinoplanes sp.]
MTARLAAATAVVRAVLVGRLLVSLVTVGVTLRLVTDPVPPALALIVVTVVTLTGLGLLGSHPELLRRRITVLTADTALMALVLLVSEGTLAFYCYAAGSAALAGAVLGTGGAALWVAQAGLGLGVAVPLLRGLDEPARTVVTPFLVAMPMTFLVCGLGAAALTSATARFIKLSADTATAVERSAAASERARLARELHDSVSKTLSGVCFAAIALPSSLRRHPALAEQLAATVRDGADAAARETRDLLAGLRRDVPDRPFADTVRSVCDTWTATSGITVQLTAGPVEPSVSARYELTQILHEALRNVARHADATRVEVTVDRTPSGVRLAVRDDGGGFPVPDDLSTLSSRGNFGMVGMSERARTVGGELRVRSHTGDGVTVEAVVPTGTRDEEMAIR